MHAKKGKEMRQVKDNTSSHSGYKRWGRSLIELRAIERERVATMVSQFLAGHVIPGRHFVCNRHRDVVAVRHGYVVRN